ncbi:MAG: TonB-dependent receptor [Pseudomonadota bacterium]
MKHCTKSVLAAAFLTSALSPLPALAQTGAPQDTAATISDSDIVVTAQRREQRLVDVPISVSAVSEATLDRAQVRNVADIATVVPNIQINQTIGNTFGPLITIRGLSPAADTSLARDQPVGLYIDGVPIGKSTGAAFDLVDLERVEVLRGPQGTLYGKNTIGGAVNLISRKPTGEFGGQMMLNGGSYGQYIGRIAVDLPEVAGFSVKLGVVTKQNDGYYRNRTTGQNFGQQDMWAGRADVLWQPVDGFSARYNYDITDSVGTPSILAVTAPGSTPFANTLIAPFIVTERTRTIGAQSALRSDFRTTGHALTLEWQPGLGDLTLKSITARRTAYTNSASDFDGTPVDLLRIVLVNDYKQVTQEFQAIGTVGDFKYTVGAFYLDDDYDVFNPRWNFQLGGNAFDVSERSGGSTSYAGYGQLAWSPQSLDEKLTVSVGGRYTREKRRAKELLLSNSVYRTTPASATSGVFARNPDGTPITQSGQPASGARPGAGGIGPSDLIPLEAGGVWKRFNPEFNVLYKFAPEFSVYGRVATGFKSGGINDTAATNTAFLTPYNPEKLTSFEGGIKFAGFDQRLRMNLAVYHSIYKDFQAGVFVPALVTTNIINAGEAKFTGVELEGLIRPVSNFTVNFGGGYIDARYTDFVLPDGTNVTKAYVVPLVPKWNYQIGALHRLDVGFATLETNLNYSWRGSQWTRITADPVSKLPGYGLLDGRIALTGIKLGNGSTLDIAAWARNLTDKKYLANAINLTVLTLSQFGDPRTFGGEIRVRF